MLIALQDEAFAITRISSIREDIIGEQTAVSYLTVPN